MAFSGKAAQKWCRRAAMTEKNPYLAAELWYIFFEETEPYPWWRIKEHFKVFKEA